MKEKLIFALLLTMVHGILLANDPNKPGRKYSGKYDEDGIFYSAVQQNLIANHQFEASANHWTLGKYDGVSATFSIDTTNNLLNAHHALINITGTPANEAQDIQLMSFMELSKNTNYQIFFDAFVPYKTTISISFSNGNSNFFERSITLDPLQQHYGPYDFKSDHEDYFTYFAFNLGNANGEVRLDNVEVFADNTNKEFDQIVANSGINIKMLSGSQELYISLPSIARNDYPMILYDASGISVIINKIREGSLEHILPIQAHLQAGEYILKIFSPEKTFAHKLHVE